MLMSDRRRLHSFSLSNWKTRKRSGRKGTDQEDPYDCLDTAATAWPSRNEKQ